MPDEPYREASDRIEESLAQADAAALNRLLLSLSPGELARAVSRLDEDDQAKMLTLLSPEDAARIIEELSDVQGADVLEDLPAETVAAILDEMVSDQRADVLGELEEEDAEAILDRMDPAEAAGARLLLEYTHDSAGGLMITEYLAYHSGLKIDDVLDDMRRNAEEYSDYGIQYCYVVEQDQRLVGVLRLRDLVLSKGNRPITEVMIPNPQRVPVDASLESIESFFDRYGFLGAPVVDERGRLIGVVKRSAVEEAAEARSQRNFLSFTGIVGGEELRSMTLLSRAPRRLSWLSTNIMLNVLSASVIAFYQGTLSRAIALAVFLPIVSDMSGCSGNQAVAVSIRELSLGIIQPRDYLRVLWKEVQIGVLDGIVLGLVLALVALAWKDNPVLAGVVGIALALNTVVSASLGGLIPLLMRRLKLDPALVSSPILTTFTDMCGFFLVLSLASLVITRL